MAPHYLVETPPEEESENARLVSEDLRSEGRVVESESAAELPSETLDSEMREGIKRLSEFIRRQEKQRKDRRPPIPFMKKETKSSTTGELGLTYRDKALETYDWVVSGKALGKDLGQLLKKAA